MASKSLFSKILFFLLISNFIAMADSNQLSYQGRLTDSDGSALPDASYQISFSLYSDSISGNLLWAESAEIISNNGFINHILGSVNSINSAIFAENKSVFLELQIDGSPLLPRTEITASAYSMSSENLKASDSNDIISYLTDKDEHSLTIFDTLGNVHIKLSSLPADASVILPDSAINDDEILDEPGITSSVDFDLHTLSTGDMVDLVTVTIETPDDGYIALYGKCYLLLSGTTGENTAIIQIDLNEGGTTQFPYYAIAGLSGYVNTGTNYFPIFVTRIYYAQKGTYTFRLEGRASNPLPAVARSWDHVLTATYFPTSYRGVEAIAPTTLGDPLALPIEVNRNGIDNTKGTYYKIDFQNIEIIDKEKKHQKE